MDWNSTIKLLHIGCVVLSLLGFMLRGWWMWRQSPRLANPAARVLPHVVDTVLLLSGVALAWTGAVYPWQQPWLAAKLMALLAYIGLGTLALKRAPSRAARGVAFVAALAVFGYMIGAALRRSPWSWLA